MVTRRPIYQWKSFWLGVVLLLFVGWAWQQGMRMNQWVRVSTPGIAFGVNQYEGQAGVFVNFIKESWDISRGAVPRQEKVWFPFPGQVRLGKVDGAYVPMWHFRVRFAHWFLMLVVAVGWTAWLRWRWRSLKSTGAGDGAGGQIGLGSNSSATPLA